MAALERLPLAQKQDMGVLVSAHLPLPLFFND
jgi:hypothetical protein